ncbi:hydroxyacid dehydrogenase [Microbacterium awajiense]|uniref:Hydroxyacid dehydrogenase n=1 Tax=Microbacterium awajiense TaxID=415214 RepID=A0ABP7ALG2_9MICO
MNRLDTAARAARHEPDSADASESLGTYALAMADEHLARMLFGADLEALTDIPARGIHPVIQTFDPATLDRLGDVEVLVTGWGAPKITARVLEALPRLRAVVHAGGGTQALVESEVRSRLALSTAGDVNAVPVAEYTLAMILLACKQVFRAARTYRRRREAIDREQSFQTAGNFGQTVGIVGASRIGRRVIALLRPFDLHIVVHDPQLDHASARRLGVELVDLEELMQRSDVVSLHAPLNDETRHMVAARELAAMKDGATLINTARGGVVDMAALETELVSGRIDAVLDVTDPLEPLPSDSRLWDLPNVLITPHVAGSMGTELRRMGDHVAGELRRALNGEPFVAPEPHDG